ncbi:unnamed protein product [Hermetia illucens]|uniref:Nuclear pore complex protein Nup214 n=1 Tax=Hermetia illucens TaxID=343691 RepID=A0A7R8UE64_HERIL|nr:unnamed protein product [Hermetia illucens]
MATEAPSSVDVTEYQFKLHDKVQVFGTAEELKSNVNLLATASPFGLIFLGNQYKPELKVIQLQQFVNAKDTGEQVLARVVTLQGTSHSIAVSCDGNLLAVNYSQKGVALLAIYDVQSFLSANATIKQTIRISADDNVRANQILWNPVIASTFALVMSDGSLSAYNLKESAFEFHSIDKQEQVKCACWSPKGKQIVAGFPKGKLVQYKPDLKPARTIVCPPNIHGEPFNTIAIQWLSTYQFAVVFLQEGEDMSPSLYIVNAPKAGPPAYINYYDVCYSASGPRDAQIFLTYVQQWNILLVASSNSMEVGVLGTTESGETPTWKQYITLDEARIELPLTSEKQETYPVGFAFETGSTHQLVIAEKPFPVMPMIHILSTHGQLVSFNFLNFSQNAPGLCSPPRPISNNAALSQFRPINTTAGAATQLAPTSDVASQQPQPVTSEVSFALPSGATSTPAQDRKSKPAFGDVGTTAKPGGGTGIAFGGQRPAVTTASVSQPIFGSGQLLGQKPASAPQFGGFGIATLGQSIGANINESQKALPFGVNKEASKTQDFSKTTATRTQDETQNKLNIASADKNKPLYTVPSNFSTAQQKSSTGKETTGQGSITNLTASGDDDALKELTKTYIQQFEADLKDLSKRSKDIDITIGNMEESKEVVKQLNELEELSNQAVESTESLAADIQGLRNSLNECFVMIAETKSKLNMYQNPELPELATLSNSNQTNRRQLIKLKSLLATNEAQLQIVNQQIDAQWSNYQDMYKKSKTKMRTPSLEGVYQTLLKQKDILARERLKINYIKSRLGVKGTIDQSAMKKNDVTIESLADSILSMSLSEQVKADRANFTEDKMKNLRNILQNRKIVEIKPQRPERIGVNSEVVREMRIKMEKTSIRDGASTKPEKMEKQRIRHEAMQTIAKPTPTKPTTAQAYAAYMQQQKAQEKQQPVQIKPVSASGSVIGFNSNIVKPTATTPHNKESGFTPMSAPPGGGISFGVPVALQKTPSSTQVSPFGGSVITKPTPSLPFGSGQTTITSKPAFGNSQTSSTSQSAFGTSQITITPQPTFGAKDEKGLAKPVPALSAFLQSENSAKPTTPSLSFTPKPSQQDKPSIGFTGFTAPNETKTPAFVPKPEASPSVSVESTSSKPQTVEIEEVKTDTKAEEKTEEKPTGPFATVSLAQSVGFGTGFSFGAASGGNIFGGKSGIAKPVPSIFGAPVQSASSTQPTSTPTAPTLVPKTSANFPPVSSELIQSTASPVATTSASLPSFSFVSKPVAETSTQPTSGPTAFSFVAKTETAPSAPTVTTTTTTVPTLPAETSITPLTTSSGTGFSLNFGTTTAPSAASAFSFTSLAKSISASSTTTAATTPVSTATITAADSTDSLFGNLNICKPTSQETTTTVNAPQAYPGSIFSASAFANAASASDTKPLFGTTTVSSTPSVPLSFTAAAPVTSATSSAPAAPVNLTTTPSSTSSVPLNLTTPPATTSATFGASVDKQTVKPVSTDTASVTASTGAPTPFGSSAATTSAFTAPPATATNTSGSGFGSTAASSFSFAAASTFGGGIPKPDQSVFGGGNATSNATAQPFGGGTITSNTPTQPFGGATQASPFGGSPTAQPSSGGNLFGSSSGFGIQSNTGGSVFGGSAPAQQTNVFGAASSNTSIFGGQKSESTNVFGTPAQPAQSTVSGFFGQSSFGTESNQPSGSIFGGGAASPVQPGAFSSAPVFGQSPFGGTQQQQQQQQPNSPFGGTAQAFGGGSFGGTSAFGQSPGFGASSPGGSFAQAGQPSVAQSGFGSPGGFSQPTFGGPPTFGGSPTFGTSPTFGGAPGFGAQKTIFGQSTGSFSPPTQKNNLFEALGSSDSPLSFGNLAQNANSASNAKQQFGGSSFSTWR